MANPDRPNGFRPVKSLTGTPINMMLRKYTAADRSADTTNNHGDIYVGDPIALASGLAQPANSGDTVAGVCVGIGVDNVDHGDVGMFDASNLEKRYLGLAESGYVWVCPAEGVVFEVQTNADVDIPIGGAADFTTDANEAHGSQTTGLSSAEIFDPAVNSDVRVVEDVASADNDTSLANGRHLVVFLTTLNAQ